MGSIVPRGSFDNGGVEIGDAGRCDLETTLEEARQRLRRLERRLELLLMTGPKDGLQDPSAAALLTEICQQQAIIEKLEGRNDGRRQDQDR